MFVGYLFGWYNIVGSLILLLVVDVDMMMMDNGCGMWDAATVRLVRPF